MKKALFLFLLLLLINLTFFCQNTLNEKTALKLSLEGCIKELLQTQQLKYAIVENGEVISEGILKNEFLSMPKLENGKERFIFIKPNNYPPFAIKLNEGEKVIKVEKIETREVKCDLSTYPKDAELCWFLKEWDEIPFDLFPLFKVGEINGKTIKLPLNKDAIVEIRGNGLLPSYTICEASLVTFKPSPPTVGWGREVRVKNREGKWLNNCFCAFIKTPESWMNEIPSGVAIPTDTFGRVVLKPEEAEERGMIVALASGYKPFYLFSEKSTFESLIITLEKGEKISGVVLGESGKPLKADIDYKMGFDNPPIKEGVVEIKTDNNGNFELPLPPLKDGFSLTFFADGYLLQTVEGNAIKSPLTIRLKKETPILGRVENKEGDPVSGAIVHFREKEVVSDFQGNFVLKNIKKENSGWVEALGYFIKSFKIEPNENFLKITLEKGNGGIKAKLVDLESNPVEEVTATAYYVSGGSKISTGSGKRIYKNGNFQMVNNYSFGEEMPEVKADIVLFTKGFAPIVLKEIKMPKGEVIDLGTIVFERGYSVIGKVKLEDGSPAVGAKVTICQFREEDEIEAWQNARFEKYQSLWVNETNSSGEFKIDGLLFGSFALFIDYPNYPELEEKIDISKSGSIGEFVLKMGRDLVVKVFSKDGNPKENFLVKAFLATDLFGQVYLDGNKKKWVLWGRYDHYDPDTEDIFETVKKHSEDVQKRYIYAVAYKLYKDNVILLDYERLEHSKYYTNIIKGDTEMPTEEHLQLTLQIKF